MERTLIARRLPDNALAYPLNDLPGEFSPEALPLPYAALDEARIDQYVWEGEYTPDARARIGWNERGIHVLQYAYEPTIRAEETRIGGRVCEDSCLEFFLAPMPEADARYVNFEINPKGVAHIGLGDGRKDRTVLRALPPGMSLTTSVHRGGWWAVSYTISREFLTSVYGDFSPAQGLMMRGNLYACDESIHPHFGTWNPVSAPAPDFHRPECFGKILLAAAKA